jgi:hypothetical protein
VRVRATEIAILKRRGFRDDAVAALRQLAAVPALNLDSEVKNGVFVGPARVSAPGFGETDSERLEFGYTGWPEDELRADSGAGCRRYETVNVEM